MLRAPGDIPDVGRFGVIADRWGAVVLDPSGAALGLFQPGGEAPGR